MGLILPILLLKIFEGCGYDVIKFECLQAVGAQGNGVFDVKKEVILLRCSRERQRLREENEAWPRSPRNGPYFGVPRTISIGNPASRASSINYCTGFFQICCESIRNILQFNRSKMQMIGVRYGRESRSHHVACST